MAKTVTKTKAVAKTKTLVKTKVPKKKIRFSKGKAHRPPKGVVYLSHVPHGFYEDQIESYFKQFGRVTAVSVPRSKTGRARGYAFVEFTHPEVAQIAADTMNNYLMLNRVIKAKYLPPEEQHPKYFLAAKAAREGHKTAADKAKQNKLTNRKFKNRKLNNIKEARVAERLLAKSKKLQEKVAALGVPYEFEILDGNLESIIQRDVERVEANKKKRALEEETEEDDDEETEEDDDKETKEEDKVSDTESDSSDSVKREEELSALFDFAGSQETEKRTKKRKLEKAVKVQKADKKIKTSSNMGEPKRKKPNASQSALPETDKLNTKVKKQKKTMSLTATTRLVGEVQASKENRLEQKTVKNFKIIPQEKSREREKEQIKVESPTISPEPLKVSSQQNKLKSKAMPAKHQKLLSEGVMSTKIPKSKKDKFVPKQSSGFSVNRKKKFSLVKDAKGNSKSPIGNQNTITNKKSSSKTTLTAKREALSTNSLPKSPFKDQEINLSASSAKITSGSPLKLTAKKVRHRAGKKRSL